MKTFIVQVRLTAGGRLVNIGTFRAKTATGAIYQAVRVIASCGDEIFGIVATEELK